MLARFFYCKSKNSLRYLSYFYALFFFLCFTSQHLLALGLAIESRTSFSDFFDAVSVLQNKKESPAFSKQISLPFCYMIEYKYKPSGHLGQIELCSYTSSLDIEIDWAKLSDIPYLHDVFRRLATLFKNYINDEDELSMNNLYAFMSLSIRTKNSSLYSINYFSSNSEIYAFIEQCSKSYLNGNIFVKIDRVLLKKINSFSEMISECEGLKETILLQQNILQTSYEEYKSLFDELDINRLAQYYNKHSLHIPLNDPSPLFDKQTISLLHSLENHIKEGETYLERLEFGKNLEVFLEKNKEMEQGNTSLDKHISLLKEDSLRLSNQLTEIKEKEKVMTKVNPYRTPLEDLRISLNFLLLEYNKIITTSHAQREILRQEYQQGKLYLAQFHSLNNHKIIMTKMLESVKKEMNYLDLKKSVRTIEDKFARFKKDEDSFQIILDCFGFYKKKYFKKPFDKQFQHIYQYLFPQKNLGNDISWEQLLVFAYYCLYSFNSNKNHLGVPFILNEKQRTVFQSFWEEFKDDALVQNKIKDFEQLIKMKKTNFVEKDLIEDSWNRWFSTPEVYCAWMPFINSYNKYNKRGFWQRLWQRLIRYKAFLDRTTYRMEKQLFTKNSEETLKMNFILYLIGSAYGFKGIHQSNHSTLYIRALENLKLLGPLQDMFLGSFILQKHWTDMEDHINLKKIGLSFPLDQYKSLFLYDIPIKMKTQPLKRKTQPLAFDRTKTIFNILDDTLIGRKKHNPLYIQQSESSGINLQFLFPITSVPTEDSNLKGKTLKIKIPPSVVKELHSSTVKILTDYEHIKAEVAAVLKDKLSASSQILKPLEEMISLFLLKEYVDKKFPNKKLWKEDFVPEIEKYLMKRKAVDSERYFVLINLLKVLSMDDYYQGLLSHIKLNETIDGRCLSIFNNINKDANIPEFIKDLFTAENFLKLNKNA